jgi:hypothetical protein
MNIVVKLAKSGGHELQLTVRSADCSVAAVLAQANAELPAPLRQMLDWSQKSGGELFLTMNPDGPNRLSETKRLSDYEVADGCTLWLMCAHLVDERQ